MPQIESRKKIKIVLTYIFVGIAVFYFLVHPFSMILNMLEHSDSSFSFSLLFIMLKSHLVESFTYDMISMSASYIVFGGVLGFIFGLFQIKLNKQSAIIEKQENILKRDISKLIKDGESKYVEFKSSLQYDYRQKITNKDLSFVILKTIVGFMNAEGGKLIIGVDDDKNVLGLDNDYMSLRQKNKDGFELKIFQMITEYIDAQVGFKTNVSFYEIKGKEICLIDVEKSAYPVYLSKGKKDAVFYVRRGNSTYPLSIKDAITYIQDKK